MSYFTDLPKEYIKSLENIEKEIKLRDFYNASGAWALKQLRAIDNLERALKRCKNQGIIIVGVDNNLFAYSNNVNDKDKINISNYNVYKGLAMSKE